MHYVNILLIRKPTIHLERWDTLSVVSIDPYLNKCSYLTQSIKYIHYVHINNRFLSPIKHQLRRKTCLRKFKSFLWMVLVHLIVAVHIIKDYILEWVFGYFAAERRPCPPLDEDTVWLSRSAVELAAMIRKQEITAQQLFEACIRRINHVNPINIRFQK